jgi:signal transduction histidine kinase
VAEKIKLALKPYHRDLKISSDWKLLGAFSASLIIVIIIGFIGIFQIQFLFTKVDVLGRRYLPMQVATLELKVSNNLYAMGIRNYAFWKSSRYLEAARAAADLKAVDEAAAEFDRQFDIYSSHLYAIEEESVANELWIVNQKQWLQEIYSYEKELRELGSRIVDLIEKRSGFEVINMSIMAFESALYRIDDFISETIQKDIINSVQEQLSVADKARRRAVTLLWWSLALGVLIGAQTAWLVYRNLKQESKRRQNIVLEMIRTEERERQHLSAQVHDQMSQDLSALKIYLGLIQQQAHDPSVELQEKITQSKKIITGLIDKSHDISLLLRPPSLDEIGLVDSLEALMIDYSRLSKSNYKYEKPEQDIKLSPEHSLYLYRLTQEALTNAAKYANAKNVKISLRAFGEKTELFYEDDGKGFDYEALIKLPRPSNTDRLKLGLVGLKERAELLGGLMSIDSSPGNGTRIHVSLNI